MPTRMLSSAFAAVLALQASQTAAQPAETLALARRAVAESPYRSSPEEMSRRMSAAAERGIQAAIRIDPNLRLTPYAREQIKAAGTAATRAREPQITTALIQAYGREFTAAELQKIIALQNQPLNRKLPQLRAILSSNAAPEAKQRQMEARLSDQEMADLDRLSADPATLQLLSRVGAVIDRVANRSDPVMEADMQRRLPAVCPPAREPLPWCAARPKR